MVLGTLLAGGPTRPGAAAAQGHELTLRDTAVITSPRIGESSGLVRAARPGIYWTINDSGNEPLLLALDSLGRDLAAWRVSGATNTDWEDLSTGPCPGRGRCLYIADIGDNFARRSHIVIYRVPEPEPPVAPTDAVADVSALDSIVLRYPDRAHDAEALAVTPDGLLYLVTKDLVGPPRLFTARVGGGGDITLHEIGALPLTASALSGRLVTGAAVSPDGRLLVVRTYASIHLFRPNGDAPPTPLSPPTGLTIPVVETQGEAIAFDGRPDELVLTSERGMRGHAILTRLLLRPRTSR
jgi:hypothetical protein